MNNYLSLYEKGSISKKDSIKFGAWIRGSNFTAHWHEWLEFMYFKTDGYVVTIDGTTYTSKKGDFYVINPFEIHSSERFEGETFFYSLGISSPILNDITANEILFQTKITNDPVIKECIQRLNLEFEKESVDYETEKKSIVFHLLSHLIKNYTIESLTTAKQKQKIKIVEILEYIELHFNEKITTETLAEKFHMNEQYFCRFFKNQTGKSPSQFINHYRMEKAILFFEETEENITDIALNVGFEDSNYFSRIFKQYTGKTPREFKKFCK